MAATSQLDDGRCGIYENRPSVCREFPVFMEDGSMNPGCIRLRKLYGIDVPSPDDFRHRRPDGPQTPVEGRGHEAGKRGTRRQPVEVGIWSMKVAVGGPESGPLVRYEPAEWQVGETAERGTEHADAGMSACRSVRREAGPAAGASACAVGHDAADSKDDQKKSMTSRRPRPTSRMRGSKAVGMNTGASNTNESIFMISPSEAC